MIEHENVAVGVFKSFVSQIGSNETPIDLLGVENEICQFSTPFHTT